MARAARTPRYELIYWPGIQGARRRIPFNEEGIFRHYPELDLAPAGRRRG